MAAVSRKAAIQIAFGCRSAANGRFVRRAVIGRVSSNVRSEPEADVHQALGCRSAANDGFEPVADDMSCYVLVSVRQLIQVIHGFSE